MYLHHQVHRYILKDINNGFHYRNIGFLKNGTVSNHRTGWIRKADYSLGSSHFENFTHYLKVIACEA